MSNYIVYKHSTPSKKVYIGITKQEASKRWKNGLGYADCTAFNRAIKKYGWDNITHEILSTGLTKEEACEEEKRLIALYKSNNPEYGYNLTGGGESYEVNDEWRKRCSDGHLKYYAEHPEARKRISESQIGRVHKPESNKKRSETMKQYFIDHPEERYKRGCSFRGKKRGADFSRALGERKSKKVYCIETGQEYKSITYAAEVLGINRMGISNMLSGRTKTVGGYRFRYVSEVQDGE